MLCSYSSQAHVVINLLHIPAIMPFNAEMTYKRIKTQTYTKKPAHGSEASARPIVHFERFSSSIKGVITICKIFWLVTLVSRLHCSRFNKLRGEKYTEIICCKIFSNK